MRHRSLVFAGFAAACFANAAVAQGVWVQASPPASPTPRLGHAMTVDPASQRVVCFGGGLTPTIGTATNELWQWNGTTWSLVAAGGTLPGERANTAACPDGNGVLVFGGYRPGIGAFIPPLALWDTWRFENGAWTQVATTGPTARHQHTMVATPAGALMFGGSNVNSSQPVLFGDTWLWNSAGWQQLAPAASPPARRGHSMAYDTNRGVAVLFGGRNNQVIGALFGDTWEWNGATWTQRAPVHSPPARWAATMAYSPDSQRVVLFGGENFGDTWAWDGTDWQQLATPSAPSARQGAAMAFAPAHQGAVLFGGFDSQLRDDTWQFADALASVTPFGSGCPGPNALVPSLAAAPGELPRIGATMHFRVGNLPASYTVPMLLLGLSNTVASGPPAYSLPFDLGVLGWPGCQELVSLESLAANVSFGTTSDFALAVPLNVALVGFTCHGQAIVFYPSNDTAVSNGVTAVVGS